MLISLGMFLLRALNKMYVVFAVFNSRLFSLSQTDKRFRYALTILVSSEVSLDVKNMLVSSAYIAKSGESGIRTISFT